MKKNTFIILLSIFITILFGNNRINNISCSNETPFWKQQKNILSSNSSKTEYNNTQLNQKAKDLMVANQKQLGFQENKGQMVDDASNPVPFVLFKAEAPNLNIWVTKTGLTYQFFKLEEDEEEEERERKGGKELDNLKKKESIKGEWHRVDMILKGANIKKENVITENDITQGDVNYYLGHCPKGIFNVKTYSKITIKEVYPGIDWVLYTSLSPSGAARGRPGLKHDFIVHPNADPHQLKLIYEGSGKLDLINNQIHFKNEIGEITEGQLLCYQGAETNSIASNYTIKKNESSLYLGAGNLPLQANAPLPKQNRNKPFSYEIGIETSNYNTNEILVIDPQLVWATFYGGNQLDGPCCVDVDSNDNLYITGYSGSSDFPVQAWGLAYYQAALNVSGDAFILRFTNSGILAWSTYYGGTGIENDEFLTIDGNNNVYVTGTTSSNNFPLQILAGAYNQGFGGGLSDAFILKFNSVGTCDWATYYGGSADEIGYSLTVDGSNNLFITGYTGSNNFPVQPWGTAYYDNSINGPANLFISRFTNVGVLTWSTYYGGSFIDFGYVIAIDGNNNIYVTGITYSNNFPTQFLTGAYNQSGFAGGTTDAFILKFTNLGVLTWATYYGGNGRDAANSIGIDGSNNVYISGKTGSNNFPLQALAGAYNQPIFGGGNSDAFILKFTNLTVLIWATYYGGSSIEDFRTYDNIVIDPCDNVYISFFTHSTDINTYATTPCGYNDLTYNGNAPGYNFGGDVFLIKLHNNCSLLWTSYFGGNVADSREALALDSQNNLFITGEWMPGFTVVNTGTYPLTNPGGGAYYYPAAHGDDDGYIAKFIPTPPTYVPTQTNPTACTCNGLATMSVTCGEAPYSYMWSNGYSVLNTTLTTNTNSNLCAGVYQVTVTSNCNYTYTTTYTLTGSVANLTANIVASNASCSSPTGSIIINSITNGVPNYTLAEATTTLASNFATPYSLTNVAVGSHTYVVTDANGCTTTFTANILPGGALPNLSVASPVILNCNPTTQTLSAASTATGSPTYSWTGPGILSGATTSSPVINAAGNYTVTLTQGLCTNSAVVVVNSNTNIPNISIANINTLTCLNNSFVITGTSTTSGVSYSWTPLSVTTASALITAAGNYTLDVTHIGSGCKTSSVITISQNTVLPNITILPTGTLSCLNTSITLTGNSTTSGASFSWSPQGVTTASALASAAGNYTFTVTDPLNGCISNSIVAVTQNTTSPNLNVNPSTTLTCLNPTATLSATSAGNTIVWNGVSLTNATNPVTVHLAGTYSATATDPISGCSTTSIITVSQNTTSPNININPATALTCLNPSTTLTAISSGNTILWNGGSLNNATNPATVNIAGTYSATATDPINGCTTTQTLTLNQNTTSPNVNAGLSQSITCSIPTVTLNGSSSTTGATFSWSPIGINTATAQVNAAGNYTLTVTDPTNGCINSATTTVIASGAFPNISISPTGTLSCLNTSLTLTGSSTTSAASFSWAPQGVNTPSALATTAGNYTFMVTDPLNGCTSSSVITITQNTTSPILNINPSTTLTCLNPIATLSATSAGNTIVWNGGSLTNATNPATINLAGTYSATATNPVNGCVDTQIITVNQNTTVPTLNITASATNLNCNTSSVTLTGSSNVNAGVYLWSTNVLGANNLPTATANNAGTYSLTVTDPLNGCFNTATVGVSSAPMFSASVVVLSQINCFGNNNGALQIGVVSGGTAPFSITNLNSGSSINNIASFPIVLSNLSAANYSILVSDANGCNQTLFATITQPAALNLALGGNSTLCEGQSTTISSNVSGGSAPYAYVWSPTGGNGANLNTGTTISTNTTFSLLLTDNNGCQAQASIAIVVNPKPNATLINNKLTGCSPVCAGFSLSAQQQPGYVYTWQFTNNQSGSVTSSQLYEPDLCFKEEGSYNAGVVISSSAGCSTTVTYNNLIQVYEKPMADFSFSPTSVTMLEPLVSFTNTSSGASVYGWYNNSSNINSLFSNQANPTYVFQEPGNYLIALVATNGSCSDTALKLIEVEEEFLFYAPNAFTPNEDNLNDTWYPLVTGYKEGSFNLLLFDRWGEQLYQSNDPKAQGWDGFYKKQLCKDDVYIWKASVKDRKGKLHQFMGYVSLLK